MKPAFLNEMEEAFAVGQHAILTLNTSDRLHWPEKSMGPLYLSYFLQKVFGEQGYRVAQYSSATGFVELNPEKAGNGQKTVDLPGQQDPVVALNRILSLVRNKKEKWLTLIHYGEHLAPQNSAGVSASAVPGQIHATEILHQISMDDTIARGESRIAIITYDQMPTELITRAGGYRTIRIDLPNEEERLGFIEFLKDKGVLSGLENALDTRQLARITSGMPLIEIEKMARAGKFLNEPVTRSRTKSIKARCIRQLTGDLLEVSEPDITMDQVAGMRHVKDLFMTVCTLLVSGSKSVTQACVLAGTPGCGKSHIVSAIANLLGWVLIQFKCVRGPYVGQSEQQLERVIEVAEQFDRSLIFFDEIDQMIGQRSTGGSGDSGTSERMLARIMSWMGGMKHRGKILFIGATNRPDILDPAILDRFRTVIPILHPSKTDVRELFPLFMERFDRKPAKGLSNELAAEILAPLNPTGRSLQEIIINAGLRADKESKKAGAAIKKTHLVASAEDYLPSEDLIEMKFIVMTALGMCSANSLLPWMNMDGLRDPSEIPQEFIDDGIVDAKTGRLNKIQLHKKIKELSDVRYAARATR